MWVSCTYSCQVHFNSHSYGIMLSFQKKFRIYLIVFNFFRVSQGTPHNIQTCQRQCFQLKHNKEKNQNTLKHFRRSLSARLFCLTFSSTVSTIDYNVRVLKVGNEDSIGIFNIVLELLFSGGIGLVLPT